MTETQRHRGPDDCGFWSSPGVSLGNCRLKILDLSEAGHQPMSTPDGRYTIVYNGEVYNYRELREQLSGVTFHSQTDTEVVLHAYARWGPSCLDRFVGMYALAVWDAKERQLFCARDRLGIKPFYFARLGSDFLFSSEIRPLLVAGVEAKVNEGVLFDFLARDFYEHGHETFFAGVSKLSPGHWMYVRNGEPGAFRSYWNLEREVEGVGIPPAPGEREEMLLSLCTDAVRLHLRSDVPLGVALSGGLDSATLLALLAKVHPEPARVEAFSFVFPQVKYSERPYVEAMTRQVGSKVHFVEVQPEQFVAIAEEQCLEQEEPFAGAPIASYALCFREARRCGFIAIMDGTGLDEGLAGYERFRPAYWADLSEAGESDKLEAELQASGITTPQARQQARERIAIAAQAHGDVGRGQDLTTSVRPDCLNAEFTAAARRTLPDFERPFRDHLRNLMYRELRYTKLPRALRFRDRLSMAVSTELRPPFLDHRLLAYAFALPPEDLLGNGVSKAILRRATARSLPDVVRLASKRSVQTPQREWFRGELRDWVRDHIDTPRFWQRGWVDRKAGLAAMEAFFNGQGDNSFFLWQWVNLEVWARLFLDGELSVRD